jgi:hypothetical protein
MFVISDENVGQRHICSDLMSIIVALVNMRRKSVSEKMERSGMMSEAM